MTKSLGKKALILGILIALVALYRVFDLGQYLTLPYLKESQENLAAVYSGHRVLFIACYMSVYILATALSVPGATVLTLAGGALLGFWVGTLVVSFASAIGATAAAFVSRFLLRAWVQKRLGDRLRTINEGVEREGKFYLFTLRLIPVFPFFVINLVMGLTRMPLRTYYWVSQLGMLPATMVYVNAGRELARIDSLSDILSPGLIFSFVLIGLFPLAAKKTLTLYRAKYSK